MGAARPASFAPSGSRSPHHAAFDDVLNGGIIGTLLDCHANWTAAIRLMRERGLAGPPGCVTADYAIRLRRPTPVDRPVQLRAWPVVGRGRPGRRRRRTVVRWHHHRHMPRHVRRRRSRPPGVRALVEEPHVRPVLPDPKASADDGVVERPAPRRRPTAPATPRPCGGSSPSSRRCRPSRRGSSPPPRTRWPAPPTPTSTSATRRPPPSSASSRRTSRSTRRRPSW